MFAPFSFLLDGGNEQSDLIGERQEAVCEPNPMRLGLLI